MRDEHLTESERATSDELRAFLLSEPSIREAMERSVGAYYTPRSTMRIVDPGCGTGGFLAKIISDDLHFCESVV